MRIKRSSLTAVKYSKNTKKKALFCKKFFIYFFFLLLFLNVSGFTQKEDVLIERLIDSFETIYGTNDLLVDGLVYRSPDSRIQNHPYLYDDSWKLADIYVAHKKFENTSVKYDIVKNDIVLKVKLTEGGNKLVRINKLKVDSFRINKHLFVKLDPFPEKEGTIGYYEQIFSNQEIRFVRKFEKSFKSVYNSITPNGKYSDLNEVRYLIKRNKVKNVTKRRSFLNYFPKSFKKDIRKYLRKNSIRYSKATYQELVQLSDFCFKKIDN